MKCQHALKNWPSRENGNCICALYSCLVISFGCVQSLRVYNGMCKRMKRDAHWEQIQTSRGNKSPLSSQRMSRHKVNFSSLAAAEAILLSHNDTIITQQAQKEHSYCPLSLRSEEMGKQAGTIIKPVWFSLLLLPISSGWSLCFSLR